ncbi:hypothetical protein [Bacillus wiedmannii]|uniref:hypothetical protein n=1 Tax=Bacillus wiedmannii TaxID=1890302 RepID=UPI0015CF496F|nr:hypothetical protein [Bacillus wiedmannii]
MKKLLLVALLSVAMVGCDNERYIKEDFKDTPNQVESNYDAGFDDGAIQSMMTAVIM